MYGLTLITPPTAEPVTLADAKTWLRVDSDDTTQDLQIGALIAAARRKCEAYTGLCLAPATWQLTLDRFPIGGSPAIWQQYSFGYWQQRIPQVALASQWWPDKAAIRLPKPPCFQVASIQYLDASGTLQTLAGGPQGQGLTLPPGALWLLDTTQILARITPTYGNIWPILRQQLAAVIIQFTAGWATTTVAAAISSGAQTVTPGTMAGIGVGTVLQIDTGSTAEYVTVTAVTSTTFTATFAQAHNAGSVVTGLPQSLAVAIKMLVASWYMDREGETDGAGRPWIGTIPKAVESLLSSEWTGEYQ